MLVDSCAGVVSLFAIHMITLKLIPFLKLPLCPLTSASGRRSEKEREEK